MVETHEHWTNSQTQKISRVTIPKARSHSAPSTRLALDLEIPRGNKEVHGGSCGLQHVLLTLTLCNALINERCRGQALASVHVGEYARPAQNEVLVMPLSLFGSPTSPDWSLCGLRVWRRTYKTPVPSLHTNALCLQNKCSVLTNGSVRTCACGMQAPIAGHAVTLACINERPDSHVPRLVHVRRDLSQLTRSSHRECGVQGGVETAGGEA